jgi:phosphoribosylamine--glycine ligase
VRVLVVGSAGREHALAWKIARSPLVEEVVAAPGTGGMNDVARCFPDIAATDVDAVVELARSEGVDLVVVGPEGPLAAGVSDRLREAGFAVFGPSQAAARRESSKTFAKDFMQRHGIPTAAYASFADADEAISYIESKGVESQGGASVVKADGLAAGKGVAMCETPADARRAIDEMMRDRRFGDSGDRIVIEEWMQGEEASYYAITDGVNIVTLVAAQDHKRALDGDQGENTGGMGAYSPAPVVTEAVEKRVLEEIVHPAIRGMAADGCPYQGVLYVGLMIDDAGNPRVVEFNVRFGDPETQCMMLQMESDLVPLLEGSARGNLDPSESVAWSDAAVCVVMASGGYPRAYETGKPITGLEDVESDPDVVVFHAGTRRTADGGFETSGGRVVGVTARGDSVREALDRAYVATGKIHFDGAFERRDIAQRALTR